MAGELTGDATGDAGDDAAGDGGLSGSEVLAVLERQTAVMEELASGAPLADVLDSIVRSLEALMADGRCSVLLLDDEGLLRHGAAPTLPTAWSTAIDGLAPGPLAGSCGTAAHLDEAVIAVDVTTDGRWVDFRDLALEHGLRACWSTPIRCRSIVVGTFAVYHGAPYAPDRHDRELVRRFTHLASLAVDHERAALAREARHEAEVARRSAERANLAKTGFVTALSHEVRTPLQAITGLTESLRTLDLTPDQRGDALRRIGDAAAHLLSIVDDVLDLARVEAGAIPIELADVDLGEAVAASIDLVRPLADAASLSIATDGPSATVRADPRRLAQVVVNLLANSVRFSPAGAAIRVDTDVDPVAGVARVHVVDRGPGIPSDLLDRLFVPFDRLGADAGREGGAGLGLVLARRLAEAMRATLEVTSAVGEGTHATVTLGLAAR